MPDQYAKEKIAELKAAQSDEDIKRLIDRIYNDGFVDGYTEGQNEPVMGCGI